MKLTIILLSLAIGWWLRGKYEKIATELDEAFESELDG